MTLKELRALPMARLVEEYDKQAKIDKRGLPFWLQEITRRDQLRYTRWIAFMTAIMTIATLTNLWLVIKLLNR